jgi:cobalt-zinc-cadmium efflux system outer membrane protein
MPFLHRAALVAALSGSIAGALAATAAEAEIAPPYATLLTEAQTRSPRLSEAAASVRQAQGQVQQAHARPNPVASVQIENFAASSPFGSDQAQTTLTVDQPIELGGKRSARIAASRAGVTFAQARAELTRVDFSFTLADTYIQAEAAQRKLALAEEALALARESLRITQVLLDAGREAQLRVLQVQATVTSAEAQVQLAKASAVDALAKLTALANAAEPYTAVSPGLLDRAPINRSAAPLDPAATPAVIAAEADRDAAARRVNVERVRSVPDLTASIGVRRFPYDNSTALVAGVSAPLPLFDRNRGNTASARADLDAATARLATARLDAEAGTRSALFRLDAATARLASLTSAEATANDVFRLTRTGYENGRISLFELLNAQRTLTEARSMAVDARLDRARAEAELARLQGRTPFGE